jgi:hypothetical protein
MHACPVVSNYLKAFIAQLEADILVFSLSPLSAISQTSQLFVTLQWQFRYTVTLIALEIYL